MMRLGAKKIKQWELSMVQAVRQPRRGWGHGDKKEILNPDSVSTHRYSSPDGGKLDENSGLVYILWVYTML